MDNSRPAETRSFLPLVGLLYVSQGVPMGLSMEALPVLMRNAGVPLEVIAWVPLVSLPLSSSCSGRRWSRTGAAPASGGGANGFWECRRSFWSRCWLWG